MKLVGGKVPDKFVAVMAFIVAGLALCAVAGVVATGATVSPVGYAILLTVVAGFCGVTGIQYSVAGKR